MSNYGKPYEDEDRFKVVFLNGLSGECSIQDNLQSIPTFYNDLGYIGAVKPLCDLLNSLYDSNKILIEEKDKKQEHIVLLENKIHRMRENIKRLEDLFHYRTADINRQFHTRMSIYEEFIKMNDLEIDWSEFCSLEKCEFDNINCRDCFFLKERRISDD